MRPLDATPGSQRLWVEIFHLDDVLQFMADFIEDAMPRTPPLRLTGINDVLSAVSDP
jgi:hypothetical protein